MHRYGHDAILRHYLTLAPYGARVHGAERAARFYFDKPAADLSWLQAAWLAGLPQQPTRLGPFVDGGLQRGLSRAHRILRTLHERGYIGDVEFEVAVGSQLDLVDRRPRPGSALHMALRLADEVRAARRVAIADHTPPPITVHATLDLEVQETVHGIVATNVTRARGYGATNGAAIVVDTDTGDVLSWVGSADYFDEAMHGPIDYGRARRSPGSALKPFVYALALGRGKKHGLPATGLQLRDRQRLGRFAAGEFVGLGQDNQELHAFFYAGTDDVEQYFIEIGQAQARIAQEHDAA